MLSVEYTGLIAPMIESIKELKGINADQAAEIKLLKSRLDRLEAAQH